MLSYARSIDPPLQQAIVEACRRYRDTPQTFIAPRQEAIDPTDQERNQDVAGALRTYEFLLRVYEGFQYELLELPRVTRAKHADIISRHLPS